MKQCQTTNNWTWPTKLCDDIVQYIQQTTKNTIYSELRIEKEWHTSNDSNQSL